MNNGMPYVKPIEIFAFFHPDDRDGALGCIVSPEFRLAPGQDQRIISRQMGRIIFLSASPIEGEGIQ
jgi:hypothetical protein